MFQPRLNRPVDAPTHAANPVALMLQSYPQNTTEAKCSCAGLYRILYDKTVKPAACANRAQRKIISCVFSTFYVCPNPTLTTGALERKALPADTAPVPRRVSFELRRGGVAQGLLEILGFEKGILGEDRGLVGIGR